MPRVTTSAFECPECGEPTRVLRTRRAAKSRVHRHRECESGHRCTTQEILLTEGGLSGRAIGAEKLTFALQQLIQDIGILPEGSVSLPDSRQQFNQENQQ